MKFEILNFSFFSKSAPGMIFYMIFLGFYTHDLCRNAKKKTTYSYVILVLCIVDLICIGAKQFWFGDRDASFGTLHISFDLRALIRGLRMGSRTVQIFASREALKTKKEIIAMSGILGHFFLQGQCSIVRFFLHVIFKSICVFLFNLFLRINGWISQNHCLWKQPMRCSSSGLGQLDLIKVHSISQCSNFLLLTWNDDWYPKVWFEKNTPQNNRFYLYHNRISVIESIEVEGKGPKF